MPALLPLALIAALGITAALAVFGTLARANAPKDGPDQGADPDEPDFCGWYDAGAEIPIARGEGAK